MASNSISDIRQRVEILEDKIDLVMKSIIINQPSNVIGGPVRSFSLYELYLATKGAGMPVLRAAEAAGITPTAQRTGDEVV